MGLYLKKCTFIICQRASRQPIGDINLFLSDDDGGPQVPAAAGLCNDCCRRTTDTQISARFCDRNAQDRAPTEYCAANAEISVMIAEPSSRRQGRALQAVRLVLEFAAKRLGVTTVRAKIHLSNTASLKMFKERLSFLEASVSEYFAQAELVVDFSTHSISCPALLPAEYLEQECIRWV